MLPAEIREALQLVGEKLDEAVADRNSQRSAAAKAGFEDDEVPMAPVGQRRERVDEEYGLAELAGILPWPGKKRRR